MNTGANEQEKYTTVSAAGNGSGRTWQMLRGWFRREMQPHPCCCKQTCPAPHDTAFKMGLITHVKMPPGSQQGTMGGTPVTPGWDSSNWPPAKCQQAAIEQNRYFDLMAEIAPLCRDRKWWGGVESKGIRNKHESNKQPWLLKNTPRN